MKTITLLDSKIGANFVAGIDGQLQANPDFDQNDPLSGPPLIQGTPSAENFQLYGVNFASDGTASVDDDQLSAFVRSAQLHGFTAYGVA
jgi:hypothetical protein